MSLFYKNFFSIPLVRGTIWNESEEEYIFVKTKETFENAESFCVDNGAKLFEPRKRYITKDVINHAKTLNINEFWLGIHDQDQEGTFVHASDNGLIEWSNWADGEPNNYKHHGEDEDCALIVTESGKWVDVPCKLEWSKRPIVCVR